MAKFLTRLIDILKLMKFTSLTISSFVIFTHKMAHLQTQGKLMGGDANFTVAKAVIHGINNSRSPPCKNTCHVRTISFRLWYSAFQSEKIFH